MNKLNWPGLLEIIEINHIRNNKIIWSQKNIKNQLHNEGELFILSCCFNNDGSYPPSNYYFGLDNRGLLTAQDTLESLENEPENVSNYSRKPISSNGEFTVEMINNVYRVTSPILNFTNINTNTENWLDIKNIFLTTAESGTNGMLISSAPLAQTVSLTPGDAINLRMGLSLKAINS